MAPRLLDRSVIRGFDLFRDMTEDNLDAVLAGDLGGVIQALQAADLAERLDQIG